MIRVQFIAYCSLYNCCSFCFQVLVALSEQLLLSVLRSLSLYHFCYDSTAFSKYCVMMLSLRTTVYEAPLPSQWLFFLVQYEIFLTKDSVLYNSTDLSKNYFCSIYIQTSVYFYVTFADTHTYLGVYIYIYPFYLIYALKLYLTKN